VTDLRQRGLKLARLTGVLPVLERFRFRRESGLSSADNAAFLAENPGFTAPPLWWMHDMYSHTSYRRYVETGRDHAADVMAVAERHLGTGSLTIADYGCGLARVLRQMPDKHDRWGFDVNSEAIQWCQDNLTDMQFADHGLYPPLPVADDTFDFIYALSVLTHLSASAAQAWMAEIHRCLRPGGVFLCTVHGTHQTGSLLPEERTRFEAGEPVFRSHVQEGSRLYVAYHPEAWLRNTLFSEFEILGEPEQMFFQEAWVLRKKG